MFRVARNLWIDSRRERRRIWTTREEEESPELTIADLQPDPEQQVLYRQRMRLIEQEVSRLPELQRECMRLKSQGLRYHEIADVLGVSMTVAVDRVRRTVKRLRTRLNP